MEELSTIGHPSPFTCPECGGALFELVEAKPPRFRCHTGHAFSLRSLASAQELAADETLWAGLRALQEKEAILRRLAAGQSDPTATVLRVEADALAKFIVSMRQVVRGKPAATSSTSLEMPSP